jgi:hypothetical protein
MRHHGVWYKVTDVWKAQIAFFRPEVSQTGEAAGYKEGRKGINLTRTMNGKGRRCCKTGQWEVTNSSNCPSLYIVPIRYSYPLDSEDRSSTFL